MVDFTHVVKQSVSNLGVLPFVQPFERGQDDAMRFKFEPWREKLRAAIVASGMSRRELSKKAGLGETFVRDVIAPSPGKAPATPSVEKLHAIVKALDLTLNDLFEDEDLNLDGIRGKMADRGLVRVFSQIADLAPRERQLMLYGIVQQMELFFQASAQKPLKSNPLRLSRIDE